MNTFEEPDIYHGILESLSTGLCIIDLQKRIVLWSEGAERITGRRRHEVMGHSCIGQPLLHCDHKDCEWCHEDCPLARAMKTSQPAESLAFVYHKRGYEIPVWVRATPVRNVHGSIMGAVATFEEPQSAMSADHREPDGASHPGCLDEITGVASRVMMQSHLREALTTFAELQIPVAVLRLRLEGLDQFRSRYGPDAASALLRLVARTLESSVWVTDCVGKWNADEFIVILNGCREQALQSVRERVRRMLATDGIEWWGERHSLPVSIGQISAETGDNLESLTTRLEQSLGAASTNTNRTTTPATQGKEPTGS
jgi:diguanylate cyclase (GGDEF)-like protein/PAS domain S-box-containing protein